MFIVRKSCHIIGVMEKISLKNKFVRNELGAFYVSRKIHTECRNVHCDQPQNVSKISVLFTY